MIIFDELTGRYLYYGGTAKQFMAKMKRIGNDDYISFNDWNNYVFRQFGLSKIESLELEGSLRGYKVKYKLTSIKDSETKKKIWHLEPKIES